jgi:hypothetical protein
VTGALIDDSLHGADVAVGQYPDGTTMVATSAHLEDITCSRSSEQRPIQRPQPLTPGTDQHALLRLATRPGATRGHLPEKQMILR